jgi:16S rRNA (cytidine1402-2'-O)-methyltransferase
VRSDCSRGFEIHDGSLYVVATPIGNLDDISARALKVLARWPDRRRRHPAFGALMQHFGIDTPLAACHEHNERDEGRRFITGCWPATMWR